MRVAVLGGGNGGIASAFDFAQHGHEVALYAPERYGAHRVGVGLLARARHQVDALPGHVRVDPAGADRVHVDVARRELRAHYARTLHLWRERFNEQWPRIRQLGFDETFRRMWEFYLAYCEAGFRAGYLDVHQLGLARRG